MYIYIYICPSSHCSPFARREPPAPPYRSFCFNSGTVAVSEAIPGGGGV